ncbi:nitrogen regulation protein NR(II) [Mariprofundus sp. EBB-1]|uniref:two-component system sensor histidine kinase NtrB n=1 Tax=Mariprofundus sp. EBB-1 TaxID=2650971 RepID=UPI001F2E4AAF|nr:ATP-binding protein [Mariprofundus sp. EBB-1]
MWNAILAGKTWHGDFTNRAKNGDYYEVSQSITPIMDEKGNVSGFASVQRDVTHLRKVQDKLQHTDRVESLGVLAGGIAHDFNNLLTAILGNAALAQRKMDDASPASKHLNAIENASHSAADLCKQMLAYSGKGMFVVKPVSLSELVEKMGKLIDVSLAKNVVLKYHLHAHLPPIDADVAQMQQIVLNLITNASEAIEGKSGVISITTGVMHADADYLNGYIGSENLETGRYIFLEVSDTGCGMDAATQRKVFDPFFTTKFSGRGLV